MIDDIGSQCSKVIWAGQIGLHETWTIHYLRFNLVTECAASPALICAMAAFPSGLRWATLCRPLRTLRSRTIALNSLICTCVLEAMAKLCWEEMQATGRRDTSASRFQRQPR